jgi:hypothetical protein
MSSQVELRLDTAGLAGMLARAREMHGDALGRLVVAMHIIGRRRAAEAAGACAHGGLAT